MDEQHLRFTVKLADWRRMIQGALKHDEESKAVANFNMHLMPENSSLMPEMAYCQRDHDWEFAWNDKGHTVMWKVHDPKSMEVRDFIDPSLKKKWEEKWATAVRTVNPTPTEDGRPSRYILSMFPYPSGNLHIGHVRVYSLGDTLARFWRHRGFKVIHPIGWDAFGLPAENAAIERGVDPRTWTEENVAQMRKELQDLGFAFDWNREFSTCDPAYYRWTQFIFLKLFEAGLAYQGHAEVNWDPVDETVLADEQVDDDGCSWRSGAKVQRRLLKQWFLRATAFSDSLYSGLQDDSLQGWRDIKAMQEHWIGKPNALHFHMVVVKADRVEVGNVTAWSLIPQHLANPAVLCLKPGHFLIQRHGNPREAVQDLWAVNPLTGDRVPIVVLKDGEHGIQYPAKTDSRLLHPQLLSEEEEVLSNYLTTVLRWTSTGESREMSIDDVIRTLKAKGSGGYWSSPHLRDWLISRQRYWGTPIPIVHCPDCGAVPVPPSQLPVALPDQGTIRGKPLPLSQFQDWVNVSCPKCNRASRRETDTMDTFMDSSWYYLRFLDPSNSHQAFNIDAVRPHLPVYLYIGGKEHGVLHLYYARFIQHFLESLGMVPCREPFRHLCVIGQVMAETFRVETSGKYLPASQVNRTETGATEKETGLPVEVGWEKMSKSRRNGVSPSALLEDVGRDTLRLLVMDDAAPRSERKFSLHSGIPSALPGLERWQKRLWQTVTDLVAVRSSESEASPSRIPDEEFRRHEREMRESRNFHVGVVTYEMESTLKVSVVIRRLVTFTKRLRGRPSEVMQRSEEFEKALGTLLVLASPLVPHLSCELWEMMSSLPPRHTSSHFSWDRTVLEQRWPTVDGDYKVGLTIKVNESNRGTLEYAAKDLEDLSADDALEAALTLPGVQKSTAGKTITKTRYRFFPGFKAVLHISASS
ncbi:unnamed protein product [Darwinula stevensoni]|uniref:leucine--tRNA ligase n=1 Tax=Darwinula stevensoni TaxID=69355 RepID=A0A7R9AER5_9CRUS|nr:unnamed protein product [Darwinula stevensoni]CAG0902593.1 unnamed protein product [Darwinula stevensoni]